MAATAWSLLMRLQGDASGLRGAVAQSETSLRGLQKSSQAVGRGMQNAGRGMTKAVTLPIIAAGGASIKMASDWESAFAGVRKTLGGDWGQDEIAKLGDDIRRLSVEELPLAATELAAIGEAGGALGIGKESMLEFIKTSAILAETTDLTSEGASTALGHLNTTMQLSQGEFMKLADAVVYLGNRGASTESQILGMTEGLAGTTKILDFAKEETLGWASALANTGEEVEAGSSSLSRFFMETFKMSQAGGKELKLMAATAGMTADAFKKAMDEDISGTLQRLIIGMQDLTKAEQLATLEALGFTDIRITRALTKLISSGDNLTTSLNNAKVGFHGSGAAGEEAAIRFATFEKQLKFVKNALFDVGIELGTTLLPIIKDDVLPVLRDGINALKGWVDWFKSLPPEGRKAVVMWAGIAAAMGPVLFIGGKILSAFGSIVGLAGGIARMTGKMGGGAGALGKLSAQPVFVTNWPPGMMAPGGGPGGVAGAAGKGGSFLGGLMRGAARVFGLGAAVYFGAELGNWMGRGIYDASVKPALDYEQSKWDQFMANESAKTDVGVLKHNLEAVEGGIYKIAGNTVDGLERWLIPELAVLESQRDTLRSLLVQAESLGQADAKNMGGVRAAVEEWDERNFNEAAHQREAIDRTTAAVGRVEAKIMAASDFKAIMREQKSLSDKEFIDKLVASNKALTPDQLIAALARTSEFGAKGVGTSIEQGKKTGEDPFGQVALALFQLAKNPKAPAVMGEIKNHIIAAEEIQRAYLAAGDRNSARQVQVTIDGLHQLIGTEDRNNAVQVSALHQQRREVAQSVRDLSASQRAKLAEVVGAQNLTKQAISTMNANQLARLQGVINSINAKDFSVHLNSYTYVNGVLTQTAGGGHLERDPSSYHEGAWSTAAGLAMLHDDEMVVPRREAKAFRAGDFSERMRGGEGSGGDTYHIPVRVEGLMYGRSAKELGSTLKGLGDRGLMKKRRRLRNDWGGTYWPDPGGPR